MIKDEKEVKQIDSYVFQSVVDGVVHVPFPSRWNGLAIRTSPRSFRKMTELERYFYETINYVRMRVDRWNYSQGDEKARETVGVHEDLLRSERSE